MPRGVFSCIFPFLVAVYFISSATQVFLASLPLNRILYAAWTYIFNSSHVITNAVTSRGESQVLEVGNILIKFGTTNLRFHMLKIRISSVEGDSVYDEEWIQQIGRQITEFLQGNVTWIGLQPERAKEDSKFQGAPVSMLDYACGQGVASKVSGRVPSESK